MSPLAVIRRYRPEFQDEPNYHSPEIKSTDLTHKDVHALKHYLDHQAVAATFFNQSLAPEPFGPDPVSAATLKQALIEYRKRTLKGGLQSLHDALKALQPGSFSSWKAAIKKIAAIRKAVDEFFEDKPEVPLTLLNGQAVIIRVPEKSQ